jgi:hypothetical protein
MGVSDLQGRDPYQVLGVPHDATAEDLRQAYRRLARRYHPDKNPQGQAMFTAIASAYGLLSDPERRLRYDCERTSPGPDEPPGEPGEARRAESRSRARPHGPAGPEDPVARLNRLYGPRPTVGTVVKLLFYLPAGGFLAVLVSAFATVSQGDAARDFGRAAALLLWLALWSFLSAAKLRLWMLYRRVPGAGRS